MKIHQHIRTLVVLFFFFLIHPVILDAQDGITLKGTVSDSATGMSLAGVVIRIDAGAVVYNTDALGNFNIPGLQAGSHRLVCYLPGYKSKTLTFVANETGQKNVKVMLVAAVISLSEVEITDKRDISQTMTSISQIDKLLRPSNSAQDLLRLVPGLFIAQHAGGGKAEQIFLRGFDNDHGTDFLVSIDGMPVNMVSHAHGQGYADFHFVIPEIVDRMNIYKGPYSARLGNFATSGAGEFFTKNAIDKSEVKFEYGAFDTYRAVALLDLLGDRHLFTKQEEHAYIAAEYVFTNSYFESPQNFNRYNLFGKYTARLNERTSLNFSASAFNASWYASGQIPERAIENGTISRFGSIDNKEGGNTSRSNVNLAITSALKENGFVKNQFYYSHYRFNLYSNFTFFLNDSINGDGINQRENGRNLLGYNGTIEKHYKLAGKESKTVFGAGVRSDMGAIALRHSIKRTPGDTIVAGNLSEQNISTWADQTVQLTNKFTMNAGLRFDYFLFNFQHVNADSISGQKNKGRVSPKLNFVYDVLPDFQLFVRSGIGFHSNDSRAVVSGEAGTALPRAFGAEAGSVFRIAKKLLFHAAFWSLDLESELVYVGDEGVVEISGATRRLGTDLALRWEITRYLFADVDFNYNHGRFKGLPEGENFIPLAPSITSTGGLTLKQEKGWNATLRYRYIDSRPANETNTVRAIGYTLFDALVSYNLKFVRFGISAENLLNAEWNEAQFDTESRLTNETQPVSELHFTPGTPFYLKGNIVVRF